MLFNVLLKAGEFVTLTRQGRFVNIVLAAGEIQGRFTMNGAKPLQTNLISGMAFEPGLFSEASFKSPVTQQAKIWIGDTPLNYSPEIARAVGSNALKSFVGQVYSGQPYPLLDAEPGRNKITLSPESDIYIGGANLDMRNGVKVKAGEVFSMQTQGAVYALETSGLYPLQYVTSVEPEQIEKAVFYDASPYGGMRLGFIELDGALWGRSGNSSSGIQAYDRHTGELVGGVNTGETLTAAVDLAFDGRYLTAGGSYIVEIDQNRVLEKVKIDGIGSIHVVAAKGDYRLAISSTGEYKAAVSYKRGPWQLTTSHLLENGAYGIGGDIGEDGTIILFDGRGGVIRSADLGQTWQGVSTGAGYGLIYRRMGLTILSGGRVLLNTSAGLYLSRDNGETFLPYDRLENAVLASGIQHPGVFMIQAVGNKVFVSGNYYIAVMDGIDGEIKALNVKSEIGSTSLWSSNVNASGEWFCVGASSPYVTVAVTGSIEPLDGLPVAIMAEVN